MPARIDLSDSRIAFALQQSRGHRAQAAKILGIAPRTLTRRLKANPRLIPSLLTKHDHLDIARRQMLREGVSRGDLRFLKLALQTFDPEGWGLKAPTPELMSLEELQQFVRRIRILPVCKITPRFTGVLQDEEKCDWS